MATAFDVKSPLADGGSLNTLTQDQSTRGLMDPIASAPRAAAISDRASAFIWRNAVTDQTAAWAIEGTTFDRGVLFQDMPFLGSNSDWELVDGGSFLNGGENTLLWRNDVLDQTAVWFVNATGFESGFLLTNTPSLGSNSPWTLVGGVTLNNIPGLVWRNQATDETAIWAFNEQGQFQAGAFLAAPAIGANSDWELVDVVGNGSQLELLWRNQGADETAIWTFNNTGSGFTFSSGAIVTAPKIGSNSPWELTKFVDVDGNNSADFVWRNRTSGEQAVWFLNGTTFQSGEIIQNAPRPDANWELVGVVSIDLQSESNLTVQAPSASITTAALTVTENLIWANNAVGQSAAWGINTDNLGATFVNGALIADAPALGPNSPWTLINAIDKPDGTVQFLWRNQSSDITAVWNINNNRFISGTVLQGAPPLGSNSPWRLVGNVIFGDSAQTTLVWRNQAADETAIWRFDANNTFVSGEIITDAPALGSNSQWELIDAFDATGTLGLLWRNPVTDETGFWFVEDGKFSSGAALDTAPKIGSNSPWNLVETGDANNDGFADLVWQNFSTGQQAIWYLGEEGFSTGVLLADAPSPDANWKIVGLTTELQEV